jgi:4-amino-4-deoxy-L-arabinose transferase-like glycosyltransferase
VPRWEIPVVAAAAVLAALAVLIATRSRVAITPDSVTYVSAARNLAHGRGYVDLTGQALTNFPPGYPALLAAIDRVGGDPWNAGRYLGAVIDASIVVLTYLLLRRHARTTATVIGGTVLIACSAQVLVISGAIASDALFIALTAAFVLVLDHLRTTERPGRVLAAAAAVVSLAFLVKYAAAALVLTGGVTVLVLSWADGIRCVLRRTLAFVGLSLVVPVLWVLRDLTTDNPDVLGYRVPSSSSLPKLVEGFVLGATRVVVPSQLSNTKALASVLVGVVIVLALVVPLRSGLWARARREGRDLAPLLIVVVGFGAFLLASERSVGADDMPRQFLPMWPVVITLAAVALEWVRDSDREPPRWRSTAVSALAIVVLGGSALWWASALRDGVPTYYEGTTVHAELASALDALPSNSALISNDPWAVELHAAREPVELAPVAPAAGFSHRPVTTDHVLAARCRGPVVLIWFDSSPTTKSAAVDQGLLGRSELTLTPAARFDGGTVYTVDAARPGAAC